MRIGLVDVDNTKAFPNIALMKISAYHKSKGDTVEWYEPFGEWYDIVYVSKVFSNTPDYNICINATEIRRGGTGYSIELIDGKEVYHPEKDHPLPDEIEHIYPDYSLYPNLTEDTAFGFLTRGCPRGCDFCIVGKKEGRRSVKVADLREFWNGQKKIVLCDPNVLACKEWKNILEELADTKSVIDFNQGLDIRLMTKDKAEMLKTVNLKQAHFAWDRYQDKDIILPKLKLYADYKKGTMHDNIVYTIVNFDTTLEQDLERIYTLRDLGYWAYVMIYDKDHCDKIYKKLQRWCNNRFIFAACKDFNDYNRLDKPEIDTIPLF